MLTLMSMTWVLFLDVGDGIAHIYGLERAMAGELVRIYHTAYMAWF